MLYFKRCEITISFLMKPLTKTYKTIFDKITVNFLSMDWWDFVSSGGVVRPIIRPSRGRDPGSNPGRGVRIEGFNPFFLTSPQAQVRDFRNIFES